VLTFIFCNFTKKRKKKTKGYFFLVGVLIRSKLFFFSDMLQKIDPYHDVNFRVLYSWSNGEAFLLITTAATVKMQKNRI